MKLKFTPSARAQFLEALEYIRQDNQIAAQRFRLKVEGVLRRLEDFPDSGRAMVPFNPSVAATILDPSGTRQGHPLK